jgi:hypothetical protein
MPVCIAMMNGLTVANPWPFEKNPGDYTMRRIAGVIISIALK